MRWNISTTRSAYSLLDPSEVVIRRTNGSPVLTVPRIVPPRRRMPVTSLVVSTRQRLNSSRPSKLSSMPMTSTLALHAGLDDGADDGVQAGRVTAAGEDADFPDGL